jgi:hypothetical protein
MGLIGGLLLFIFCVYGITFINELDKKPLKKFTEEEENFINKWLKKKGEYNNCLKNKNFIDAASIGRQLSFGEDRIQTDILSHSK